MTVKEVKRIDDCKLRSMCIRNNWYTLGNCSEYSAMFSMCDVDNVIPELLYKIAFDIYRHTDVCGGVVGCSSNHSNEENILNMMIYINDCTYVYYEICK